jgi:hypothetical protein
MVHFVETILRDLKATPSLSEGRAAFNVGLAAFDSTKTGRLAKVRV